MKINVNINSINEVVKHIKKTGIYLLVGTLASGKTTLVNAISKEFLGEYASSPTFSILNTYENEKGVIYHYDIYQKGTKAFLENGLFENLFNNGLHLVEWADDDFIKILEQFGLEYTVIQISILNEERLYEFS